NSKSSAVREDKNPFGERGAESKAVSCLTGKADLWALDACYAQSELQDDICIKCGREKPANGRTGHSFVRPHRGREAPPARRFRPRRLRARRIQQPVALHLDRPMALAGGLSQTVDVGDVDVPAAVADETGPLKRVRHERDGVAL